MSTATADWKDEARNLREQGLSEREIAEAVGKSPSTVHEAVKDVEPGETPAAIPGQQDLEGGEVPAESNGHGKSEAVAEFEREAGPAVGDMPPQPPAETREVYIEEIRVDGTSQVAIDFGGKKAQSAKLAIAGSATVDGFFRKGDRIRGSFEAVVTGAGGKDKIDKQTGIVIEAVQTHSARITDLVLDG